MPHHSRADAVKWGNSLVARVIWEGRAMYRVPPCVRSAVTLALVMCLLVGGLPHELRDILPGPLAQLGPLTAEASTLAPSTVGTGTGINLRRNAGAHFFMSGPP